jgi:hypothetical protein
VCCHTPRRPDPFVGSFVFSVDRSARPRLAEQRNGKTDDCPPHALDPAQPWPFLIVAALLWWACTNR